MKDYYQELIKYAPTPIEVTEREELKKLWAFEAYPCLDTFLDFYECFQKAQDIRQSFLLISPIEEIFIENNGLVFAHGHQNLYPIGVELSDMIYENPRVKYQTSADSLWFIESGSLQSYLFNIAGWQIINVMYGVTRIKINEDIFREMIGTIMFDFTPEKSVTLRSPYRICQNKEKNILGCYSHLEEVLYFGSTCDEILHEFGEKNHFELDWL